MSVYRAANGRWRIVIHLHGQRRDFKVTGSKAEAEAFEARKRADLEMAGPVVTMRTVPQFSDFCVTRYRAQAELNLAASTWAKQQYIVTDLVTRLGSMKINQIGANAAEKYAQARHADGLGNVAINNELRVLRRILNYAQEQGYAGASGNGVKLLNQPPSGRVHAWTEEEVSALFASCRAKSPTMLPIVIFLVNTGCRAGEALALKWERVNFTRGLIEIYPSKIWRPKNGKPREIPISDALLPWLKGASRATEWVFPSDTGDRFSKWPARKFDRARQGAGLKGGPHTLRHTFASHFLQHTPDLHLLALLMGHSDLAVTRLYTHALPGHLDRARNAVSLAPTPETLPATLPG